MKADKIIWMRLKINWIRIPNTDVVGSLRNKYQPEACWGGITTVHCFSSSLTILDQSLYVYCYWTFLFTYHQWWGSR